MTPTPLTILVTGSRDWTDAATIRLALEATATAALWDVPGLKLTDVEPTVVHGACPFRTINGNPASADILAGTTAYRLGWRTHKMAADWQAYGRIAGPIRNAAMVKFVLAQPGIHACVAFPLATSRGTLDCIRQAQAAGIPVTTWRPNTNPEESAE